MAAGWKVLYYEDRFKHSEILEFIESRNSRNQAKIMAYLELLEERGPNLPRPYVDILKDGIHELRVKLSGEQIRMMYFFTYQKYIVLTHAFIKNTSKVPDAEILKSIKYRNDFISRFDKELKEGRL